MQVAFASGTVWIHPEELEKLPEGPAERLAAGELGHAEPYGLRLQSLYLKHAYRYDPLTGLSSARIEPQLHQVFVAHRVAQKLQPRMILADEVGLGKTIEAGLIVKELRAGGLIGPGPDYRACQFAAAVAERAAVQVQRGIRGS